MYTLDSHKRNVTSSRLDAKRPGNKAGYTGRIESIRKTEYPHLQGERSSRPSAPFQLMLSTDTTYLDHAGITPYAKSLVTKTMRDLHSHLYGNPHSQSPSSILSMERVEKARLLMLEFFRAHPEHFDLIFVANATAAMKLVADGLQGRHHSGTDEGFWYGYHAAAHTSLVGVREVATASTCFDSDEDVETWLSGSRQGCQRSPPGQVVCKNGLFAYPAQSNMNGRRLPLNWPGRLRHSPRFAHRNMFSLLDAAAYVTTAQLDLSDHQEAPDFVALSFHKIFGFPDLGALIVRKEAGHVLRRTRRDYFGGGTVDMITNGAREDSWHASKLGSLHEAMEDGTQAFHSILALEPALQVQQKLYSDMASVSQHTCRLSKYLYDSMSKLSHANGVALCRIYKDPSSRYGDSKTQGPTVAFNIQTSAHEWIKKSYVEQLAVVNGIQLRTGGVCNPGGIAWALGFTVEKMKDNYAEGLRCGNGVDELNGKPTGIIRVSLGAMSNEHDITVLLAFLRLFIEGFEGDVGAASAIDESVPGQAINMPLNVRILEEKQKNPTETVTTLHVSSENETDDLQRMVTKHICPVVACKAATENEEELVTHFQVHNISDPYRNSTRNLPRLKLNAGSKRLMRAVLKDVRHFLCFPEFST